MDADEIVRLRVEERLSMRAIAERARVDWYEVRRVLVENGLPPRRDMAEDGLAALRAYAEETGSPPSMERWKRERRRPSATTIARAFGSWANAMVAAGFEGRAAGDSRSDADELDRVLGEYQARVDAGARLTELAPELGVTPQSLGRRLRRWRELYGQGVAPPRGPRPRA